MQYFRPFANNVLFLLQKLNIRHKVPHVNPPSRKNSSCMQRMPMYFFPARLINEIFPKWTRLILWM